MSEWYIFLGQLSSLVSSPLKDLSSGAGMPVLSAFILGLIGAASPCQLSSNLAAISYVSGQGMNPRRVTASMGAYLAGKVVVYSALGLVVLLFGLTIISGASVPFFVLARRSMGPILLLSGVLMVGLLRLNLSLGEGLSRRLRERAARGGSGGAFLLGAGFSLAFCPTFFVIFFGLLLPLSMQSAGGFIFPGVFALGTALPLVVLGPLVALGLAGARGVAKEARRVDRVIRWSVGIVFILLGINETFTYWMV